MRPLTIAAVLALMASGCALLPSPDAPADAGVAPPVAAPETDDSSADEPSAPAPTASASPSDDGTSEEGRSRSPGGTDAPPFPADTSPDTSPGHGMPVTLTDIRVGRHPGFDRVVFDLGGEGRAGWHVRYVDDPRAQGSGDPVDVAGDAVLEVDLSHTGYPEDTGVAFYDGPRRIAGSTVVVEIVLTGMYEGQTQLFVGVSAERPFRVHAFDDRVILDIVHGAESS